METSKKDKKILFFEFTKEIVKGFICNGAIALLKIIKQHPYIVVFATAVVVILCTDDDTEKIAWCVVLIVSIYGTLKSLISIFNNIKLVKECYDKARYDEVQNGLHKIGGNIFDIVLAVVGAFQAAKIIRHSANVAKGVASLGVVDDATQAATTAVKNISS